MVCKVLMSRVHLYFFVKTENLIVLPPRNKHLNQELHKLLKNTEKLFFFRNCRNLMLLHLIMPEFYITMSLKKLV